jgi:DNA-binding IclR family transcriptional regulator
MLDVEMPSSILSKAFYLLRAFNSRERVMTLSELTRASGLPKSTVHRLLARLVELGAIESHGAGYKLGLELFQLGSVTPAYAMRDTAMPHLAAVHRWTGRTVSLALLRGFDVVYLERVVPCGEAPGPFGVGSRVPANCTAMGKALLAYEHPDDLASLMRSPLRALTPRSITDAGELTSQLRSVRQGELARASGEARRGIACVASPIIVKGCAVGAISVSHPVGAKLDPRMDGVLRETTALLGREVQAGLADQRAPWFPPSITDPELNLMRNAG